MVTRRFVPYFAALCLLAPLAHAAPVTYYFGGQWTHENFQFEPPASTPKILLGGRFDGSFTFDSAAADSQPSPQTGTYGLGAPAFHFTTGNYTFDIPGGMPGAVRVQNLTNPNFDSFQADVGVWTTGTSGYFVKLYLQDSTGLALNSDALPVTPLQLGAFDFTTFELRFNWMEPGFGVVSAGTNGPLDYLSLTAPVSTVPEPASAALLLSALALLPLARRSNKQSNRG